MKLVCETCGAKYSIADDRVTGRVFKVRCKKCSDVIIVRGATREVVPGDTPSGAWHAIIDGGPRGPLDRDEITKLAGTTLVWREGMSDWAAIESVRELQAGDEPRAAPAVDDSPKLRGERNATSVLFTLGSLAQLAAPKPAPVAADTRGEGSGLIDIRALASTMIVPAREPQPHLGGHAAVANDIPTFGPVGFADPIVLVPQSRANNRRGLYAALAATAALLVVVAALLVVMLARDTPGAAPAKPAVPDAPAAAAPPPVRPPAAPPTSPPPPEPPAQVAPPAPAARPAAPPRKKPKKPHVKKPAPAQECTDVSCLINNYEGACCEKFEPRSMR